MIGPPVQPFEGLTLIERFPSKKNAVYLVERGGSRMVLKSYDNARWRKELDVLEAAYDAGIPVPCIVEARDGALLMEFLPGRSVNDYLETDRMKEMTLCVAGWLARFHNAFRRGDEVLLKSDAILKNFIISDRVYGIDFELSRMGRPEEDVGEALAYLLSAYPMFTGEKYLIGSSFIERYEQESGVELRDIDTFIARSLREASAFRPGQREALLKKATEIVDARPFTRVPR